MSTIYTSRELDKMDKRYRAKFINCLSGIKSANLVGTIDENEKTNLSMISSCVHLGASPSLMGMVIRPRSVPRHTFDNLKETKSWTINHVTEGLVKQAHQTSARYPKEISEFDAVGLTPEFIPGVFAPFVKEASLKFALKLVDILPIKQNGTEFVIGEITHVCLDEKWLDEDGSLRLEKAGTLGVSGLDEYVTLESLYRLSYAKPDKDLEEI